MTVTWTAQTSLTGTLELVCNGVVVASQQATAGPGSPVTLSTTVNFPASGWLCARRMDPSLGHQAHTAAVFVTVNGAPVRASANDAQFYVQWMENLLAEHLARWGMEFLLPDHPDGGAGALPDGAEHVSADRHRSRRHSAAASRSYRQRERGGVCRYPLGSGAWINAGRFQAVSNATVSTVYAQVGTIAGHYKCAIYSDVGGSPSAFLRGTAEVSNPTEGWQAFPLTSSFALTNGTYYWLAIWSDDANAEVYYSDNGGTLRWGQYNYGTWPNPITTTGGGNFDYCIYAASSAGPAPTLTSIAVTPTNATLVTGTSQPFTATGTYSDGSYSQYYQPGELEFVSAVGGNHCRRGSGHRGFCGNHDHLGEPGGCDRQHYAHGADRSAGARHDERAGRNVELRLLGDADGERRHPAVFLGHCQRIAAAGAVAQCHQRGHYRDAD